MAPAHNEEEKVIVMILKVDLKCHCCYKKVKKLLCKFPQIRNQVFDEDKNKVTITVACCDPQRIRDKLYCKGGKTIQCIEIAKPPVTTPSKPNPTPPPVDTTPNPPQAQPEPTPNPTNGGCPQPFCPPPVSVCCQQCYEGHGGGPCHYGYGRPVPPPWNRPVSRWVCYDTSYGYPNPWNRPYCCVTRCGECFSEENPYGCANM